MQNTSSESVFGIISLGYFVYGYKLVICLTLVAVISYHYLQ